jgi:hypothetical protein
MSDIGFSLYPIVLPSNFPSTSDLASVHARKGQENWDNLVEQAKEQIARKDYIYELYVKRAHENEIRMEIFHASSIDVYV